MSELKTLLKLIRIKQWYKNIVIFLPLVFTFQFLILETFYLTILGFISLGLVVSGIYILNDIRDIEIDKLHPRKKNRPIAAGLVTIKQSKILFIIFLVMGFSLSSFLSLEFSFVLLLILINNLIYFKWTKNIVFLDIISISMNFVLRVVSGIILLDVLLSPWLIGGVFLVALFLGFMKRKNELQTLKEKAETHRKTLMYYSISSLNKILITIAALVITTYSVYVMIENPTDDFTLAFTIPIVAFIIFRQIQLSYKTESLSKADEVINDIPTLCAIISYILLTIFFLYFK